jgi:hypothetical protein
MACGIDLARSDLGLKSAFPVLIQNFIQWCVPSVDEASAYTLTAGEASRRTLGEAFKARGLELQRSGPTLLLTAHEEGFFEWTDQAPGGTIPLKGFVAVNVPAGELDVAPRLLQSPGAKPGAQPGAQPELASTEQTRSLPLAGWAILLLVLCLAAEWIAWKGAARWAAALVAAWVAAWAARGAGRRKPRAARGGDGRT